MTSPLVTFLTPLLRVRVLSQLLYAHSFTTGIMFELGGGGGGGGGGGSGGGGGGGVRGLGDGEGAKCRGGYEIFFLCRSRC